MIQKIPNKIGFTKKDKKNIDILFEEMSEVIKSQKNKLYFLEENLDSEIKKEAKKAAKTPEDIQGAKRDDVEDDGEYEPDPEDPDDLEGNIDYPEDEEEDEEDGDIDEVEQEAIKAADQPEEIPEMDEGEDFEELEESAKSDAHEVFVARNIQKKFKSNGLTAERPKVGTGYPDVLLTWKKSSAWLEVKMGHRDNLSNPRVFFDGEKWDTTYKTPTAKFAVTLLNNNEYTKKFIKAIKKFSGIKGKVELPTSKRGLNNPNAVPLDVMKEFFDEDYWDSRYIAFKDDVDMGALVTAHYIEGKSEPASYMQAGDDFYLVGKSDPFKLQKFNKNKIPLLEGSGIFKVRVATRSSFYEIQTEVKIDSMPESDYSCIGEEKINPFDRLR